MIQSTSGSASAVSDEARGITHHGALENTIFFIPSFLKRVMLLSSIRPDQIPQDLANHPIWRHFIDNIASLQSHIDDIQDKIEELDAQIEKLEDALEADDTSDDSDSDQ